MNIKRRAASGLVPPLLPIDISVIIHACKAGWHSVAGVRYINGDLAGLNESDIEEPFG